MFASPVMNERLTLEQQIARKEAQLAKLKGQQRTHERTKETRRLIYHGRLLEKFIATGVIGQQQYDKALDELLTRNYDREFFGLPLNPDEPKHKRNSQQPSAAPIQIEPPISQEIVPPKPALQDKRLYEHHVSEADFLT
jgi:hypothetical protein